jgi:membrane associated rhomboid family serine protease
MALVAVARSVSRRACEERALVLHAVGIASELASDGKEWLLLVESDLEEAATTHLERYRAENPERPPPSPAAPPYAYAWIGSVAYSLVLLTIGWLAGHHALGVDWWDAGALAAAELRDGEWWRALTALTLHVDIAHLVGNIGFGAVFGFLAAQLLGVGVAWGTVLLAAALANVGVAWIAPREHVSLGASTAVFAALGLLASYAWRSRADARARWAYRWAPLIAGVALLAFTGAGGERTDVLAHLLGFAVGVLAGIGHAQRRRDPPVRDSARTQWFAAGGAIALLAVSWAFAIAAFLR